MKVRDTVRGTVMKMPEWVRRTVVCGLAAVAGVFDASLPAHPTGLALAFQIFVGLGNLLVLVIVVLWCVNRLRDRFARRSYPVD
jgi:hypothetical protein